MKWKLYVENIYVYCNLFHQIEKKEKKNFEKFTISMNRKKKSSYIVGNDEIFN